MAQKYHFRAAPYLICPGQTSIKEAMELMSKKGTTYVLVTDTSNNLRGIFTRADVFKKFNILHETDALEKPVNSIATFPVISVTLEDIHTAPKIMLYEKVGHLPVIKVIEGGGQSLVGILTRKSIFNLIIQMNGLPDTIGGQSKTEQKHRQIAVISPDGSTFSALDAFFKRASHVSIHRHWIAHMTTESQMRQISKDSDAIIIDIDGAPDNRWREILKFFNSHPDMENVCLLYNPMDHPSNLKPLFDTLERRGWLHVYTKPVDIATLALDLEMVWNDDDFEATVE